MCVLVAREALYQIADILLLIPLLPTQCQYSLELTHDAPQEVMHPIVPPAYARMPFITPGPDVDCMDCDIG